MSEETNESTGIERAMWMFEEGGDKAGSSSMGEASSGESSWAEGVNLKKGPWTAGEDEILKRHVKKYGEGNWNSVQKRSGLTRCGKSCRLRWANHLKPNLKKGPFTQDEAQKIIEMHAKWGNKWAKMAAQLKGRTDNEIKNFWNTRVKRCARGKKPIYPPHIQPDISNFKPMEDNKDGFCTREERYNNEQPLFPSDCMKPAYRLYNDPVARDQYFRRLMLPSFTGLNSIMGLDSITGLPGLSYPPLPIHSTFIWATGYRPPMDMDPDTSCNTVFNDGDLSASQILENTGLEKTELPSFQYPTACFRMVDVTEPAVWTPESPPVEPAEFSPPWNDGLLDSIILGSIACGQSTTLLAETEKDPVSPPCVAASPDPAIEPVPLPPPSDIPPSPPINTARDEGNIFSGLGDIVLEGGANEATNTLMDSLEDIAVQSGEL
ncbi:transcription factor MYB65-like isoform X2 [Wolffia australiana]